MSKQNKRSVENGPTITKIFSARIQQNSVFVIFADAVFAMPTGNQPQRYRIFIRHHYKLQQLTKYCTGQCEINVTTSCYS